MRQSIDQSVLAFKPLLEQCGYTGSRLRENYRFGNTVVPLAAFSSKPWDFDSACIAAVHTAESPEAIVRSCFGMGAPIVWVRRGNDVEWWTQHPERPSQYAKMTWDNFPSFVHEHRFQLDPVTVYRGKTIARVDTTKQLDFVDMGLLPMLREEAGQKLHDLVEQMIFTVFENMPGWKKSRQSVRIVFSAVFRLLAGKILKDKEVPGFKRLRFDDPALVLDVVGKHYGEKTSVIPSNEKWKKALSKAASLLVPEMNFSVLSPEALAYVYEHTLVSEELRKSLGIHATPPWLVDYMVWRLDHWVQQIPRDQRHVFEPACGHAPFLLSAMRLLRLGIGDSDEATVHAYVKQHLHGIELDDFAREIARLTLTLADIPNPNGWDLQQADMFEENILADEASRFRILFSNPPYEKFTDKEKERYHRTGSPVKFKKAVELLHRTLGNLGPNSIFGVIVPQGVVSGQEALLIRREILSKFQLIEVLLFPGKVFGFAQHETAVILARECDDKGARLSNVVHLRQIGEHDVESFQKDYKATWRLDVRQDRLLQNEDLALWIPMLDDVWQYLAPYPQLQSVAKIGRGIEYKGSASRNDQPISSVKRRAGYSLGTSGLSKNQQIFDPPVECWLSNDPGLINSLGMGKATGRPQILMNRVRTSRSSWRIKALLDLKGLQAKDNYVVIRPSSEEHDIIYLWAILNSPVANAFIATRTMRKHNYEGLVSKIPIPQVEPGRTAEIVRCAIAFRELATARQQATKHSTDELFSQIPVPSQNDVYQSLLRLDAEVLRVYNLPPKLERQLLCYFSDTERYGVGADFYGFYPPGFESALPLYFIISENFRRAAADKTVERFKPGESDYINEVLRVAAGGD